MFTFFIENIEFLGKFYKKIKIEYFFESISYDVDLMVIEIDFLIMVIYSLDMQLIHIFVML
jgi:hypothetical protein